MPAKRMKSFTGSPRRGATGVVEVGEPLDLGRNIGQPVELGGGREPVGGRFRSAAAPRVDLPTWAVFSLIIGFDDKT